MLDPEDSTRRQRNGWRPHSPATNAMLLDHPITVGWRVCPAKLQNGDAVGLRCVDMDDTAIGRRECQSEWIVDRSVKPFDRSAPQEGAAIVKRGNISDGFSFCGSISRGQQEDILAPAVRFGMSVPMKRRDYIAVDTQLDQAVFREGQWSWRRERSGDHYCNSKHILSLLQSPTIVAHPAIAGRASPYLLELPDSVNRDPQSHAD